ncbi:MAG: O-antigen ligase family protein [Phycisphaeraceae bacterium]
MKFQFGWIFTNVLALAGVSYGWLNPYFGLMVYYVFVILRPNFLWFWAWDDSPPRYLFYIALATIAGWLLSGMGDWRGLRKVILPLAALAIYVVDGLILSQTVAIAKVRAWDFLYPQITIVVMMVLGFSLIRTEKQIRTFAWIITAGLGYLAWVFNSHYYFGGINRIYTHGFGGIDNNGSAMIFVMAVPLSFFMGMHEKKLWVKAACLFAAVLQMHVVLLTFSRGGQLGLVIVGAMIFAVALVALPRKLVTLTVAVLFVALTLHLAGAEVRQRFWMIFADERDASAESRPVLWAAAWRCMLDHPFGVGPRNFNIISHQYGMPPNKSVHNLFLQTGADYGFIGMFSLAIFYFSAMFRSFFMCFNPAAKRLVWARYYGQMCTIALSGMLICSIFIGMESVEHGFIIAMLGLCTAAYIDRIAVSEPKLEKGILPELEEVPTGREYEDLAPA